MKRSYYYRIGFGGTPTTAERGCFDTPQAAWDAAALMLWGHGHGHNDDFIEVCEEGTDALILVGGGYFEESEAVPPHMAH